MTYEEFEAEIYKLTGIELVLYKEKQMKRRIETLIARQGLDGFESYIELLRRNRDVLENFLDYITINVTEFFRTPEHWSYMADTVLPHLPDDAVIWSCACATGEEAYSLAISIAERRSLANIRIIATDIDDKVLEIARKGEYIPQTFLRSGKNTFSNVYATNMEKHFIKTDKGYRVCDEIRSHVEFSKLNLLADDFPQCCSLIACRNVLIYFTDEAKHKLYQQFRDSLLPGGYLFTGHAEQIIRYKDYGFSKERGFLLKKDE